MMMAFNTRKLRAVALATGLLSAGSLFSLAHAATTYALVQINQQALFLIR